MATQSELQLRITEAEAALHSIATGSSIVEIDDPVMGRVKFSEANIEKLQAYVQSLKTQYEQGAIGLARRPIYFRF